MADNDRDQPPPPRPETVALAGTVTIQTKSALTVQTAVVRAPFSEADIAERVTSDPEFYRRLAAFIASELRTYGDGIDTQDRANASHVIRGKVTELADGFDQAASALTTQNGILTPEAAARAAAIVSKVRNAYAALCSDHPDLVKVAKICLAGLALYQFGHVPEGWAGLISYAVIERKNVSDILWGPNKNNDDGPSTKT